MEAMGTRDGPRRRVNEGAICVVLPGAIKIVVGAIVDPAGTKG